MNKEAAEILALALEKDATDHESGQYHKIGLNWDDVYGQLLPIENDGQPIYGLALNSWDDWCDAANHEWQYHEPINSYDLPILAREIANSFRSGTLPDSPTIINNFMPKLRERLVDKIKKWFKTKQSIL